MAFLGAHLIHSPAPPPSFTGLGWSSCRTSICVSAMGKESKGNGRSGRRIWRRRKLTKKDDKVDYKLERIPFLEEQVRRIRESGEIISLDIEKLMLSEENRFAFVNEVAEEAKSYVERNRDEYGEKKAILHVLSNRMNEAGFERTEAYMEPEPFRPGPGYIKHLEAWRL
ncbi:protein PLASTID TRANSCRIPTIONALLY ACTIVE 7 [Dioscorea cayenensis subsp. rotundata]|uniref:Protein PLASTID TRANSCRIPTIONALLY ACTIVE 7 n=1 Tax=Dioscorea cayennensis subsp. rotundata TaxID=55577 RepID=A0AB40B0M9_DIOCR|nr:protein PLASTID TRANSCRIPTIONALLY ACTIVE 7 [Dioscorea cayenensis subsp. rotundata]